jgi:hypothetical protein
MPDIKALERLISVLSEVEEGSRELDVRISVALGELQSESVKLLKLFVEEGYDWRVISGLLDTQVPAYSTSLDAAVPGENIVGVLYSAKRGRWAAVHRAPGGHEVDPLWASTEVLARRAVGLAGLVAEQRGAAAAQPAAPSPGGDGVSESSGAPDAEAEPREWKILF